MLLLPLLQLLPQPLLLLSPSLPSILLQILVCKLSHRRGPRQDRHTGIEHTGSSGHPHRKVDDVVNVEVATTKFQVHQTGRTWCPGHLLFEGVQIFHVLDAGVHVLDAGVRGFFLMNTVEALSRSIPHGKCPKDSCNLPQVSGQIKRKR